ncbi:MAG: ABC transporter permease subunit [Phycisphaeraceae bacterium]|nr:ABC transporter permease subunit [Phycisphaeraceae bacterium]
MHTALVIAKRELTCQLYSSIGYVVLALFALGTGLLFFGLQFQRGAEATMRSTFTGIVWLLIFLAPAISMRLLSDEFRSGSIETLMTAPVSDGQIIVGKWLGAMGYFVMLMLPVAVLIGVLEACGDPDYGPLSSGLLGLLLVGGFYLAIGTFASALSENQIIAFLLTIFIISFFTFVLYSLPNASFIPNAWREGISYAYVNQQFDDFGKGLIALRSVIFFLSGIALFLFLAAQVLESRRWR